MNANFKILTDYIYGILLYIVLFNIVLYLLFDGYSKRRQEIKVIIISNNKLI